MITEELNCETVFNHSSFWWYTSRRVYCCHLDYYGGTYHYLYSISQEPESGKSRKKISWHWKLELDFLQDFFTDILGERGKRYVPYLITVAIYIGVANLIGLLGFKTANKNDLNVTAGLAIMSICLIEYSGFRQKRTKRFLYIVFAEPMAIVTPINIMEIAIRPYPFVCDFW